MDRYWGHALSAGTLLVVIGSTMPACTHDSSTLFVQGVLLPPTPTNNQCIYTVSPTSPMIGRGRVDAGLTQSYTPEFLLGSQMRSTANTTLSVDETGEINIQGAIVKVIDPVDNSVQMNKSVLTAGTILPAAGTTSTYLAIPATILDQTAMQHFDPGPRQQNPSAPVSKLAEVYVTFYGQSLGGTSIESQEFEFPVDVCDGCLVSFPVLALPTNATDTEYCSGAVTATTSTTITTPCEIGQDQETDCTLCYQQHRTVCSYPATP